MPIILRCVAGLAMTSAAGSYADSLHVKAVTALQVVSVKVDSFSEFPVAFEKLEQYCETDDTCAIRPQITFGSGLQEMYAGLALEAPTHASAGLTIVELPPATVAVATHRGSYASIQRSVRKLINAARAAGYAPEEKALLRLLHMNRPGETPSNDLVTEIQLPVRKN